MPVAAGKFYPADADALRIELEQLFESLPEVEANSRIRALITPHAGYIFSGIVAASAFASVPKEKEFSNIFIIGTSHRRSYEGASVYSSGEMLTPLGRVSVNHKIANTLMDRSEYFIRSSSMHDEEHCIEVQLPFIQYYFRNKPTVIPILIGTVNISIIRSLAETLKPWFTDDNLFLISSDFSHYPSYNDAIRVDNHTSDAIVSGNPQALLDVIDRYRQSGVPGLATIMCGWTSGLLLMFLTESDDMFEYRHIMYRNSGDSRYGNKDGVVGYHSIMVIEKTVHDSELKTESPLMFTKEEEDSLFFIAHNSIRSGLNFNESEGVVTGSYSGILTQHYGVFVTIYIGEELRGCIGRMESDEPLCNLVSRMAFSAAFEDPRFSPLTRGEYDAIKLEISVLTPLKRIININEIIIGKHGLYLRKEGRSGVLLPQVAIRHNWTVLQFLQYTARYKANIGEDGWRDADIYIFESSILREHGLKQVS